MHTGVEGDPDFEDLWRQICRTHVDGEEFPQYFIDRCLMCPRALIELVGYCRSHAVNLGREKIELDDIKHGEERFSVELLTNIGFELRDVFPSAKDVLYEFPETSVHVGRKTPVARHQRSAPCGTLRGKIISGRGEGSRTLSEAAARAQAIDLEVKSSGGEGFHLSRNEWSVAEKLHGEGSGDRYAVLVVRRARAGRVPAAMDLLSDPVALVDAGLLRSEVDGYQIAYRIR